jgi:hypothetical protein
MVDSVLGTNAPTTSSIGRFTHRALDAYVDTLGNAAAMTTPLCLLKFVQNRPKLEEAVKQSLSKEPSEAAKQIYRDVGR